jgi:dihydroorotate dehydrogenase (NAD+) catalytic subunit
MIDKPNLEVEIAGIKLKNPVMTASGTFGYGQEFSPFIDLDRLGAMVLKGITLKPKMGNPPPRVIETPSGMLNSIGLQNVGVEMLFTKIQYSGDNKYFRGYHRRICGISQKIRRGFGGEGNCWSGGQHFLPQCQKRRNDLGDRCPIYL